MKNLISYALLASAAFVNIASAENSVPSSSDRYIYFGTEFGISDPIVKSFKHKASSTNIRLKKSHLYGGRIGYSFYPNMMIELSGTHQPTYRLAYILPRKELTGGMAIPGNPGITNVSSNIFSMNLIYELNKVTSLAIKPYVIFGAGIAKTSVKPTSSYYNNIPYFKIQKTSQNSFAWQAGIGVSKNIATNFDIDFAAKMQVINNIKIKYQTLNLPTMSFNKAETIKKNIGVGEFTVGLTYKFPLNK
jgi:opacity protein-like surface antigen